MKLTDYLNSINHTKEDVIGDDARAEKLYPAFPVNRCLSYFPDTILQSNMMNFHNHLSNKMQYDYLRHSLRSRKRFSKWINKREEEDLDLIKQYFNYSNEKAKESIRVLTEDQLQSIRDFYDYGG